MPRAKSAIEKKQIKGYISADLKAQIDLLLYDPVNECTQRGALSDLLETLLRQWIREQQEHTYVSRTTSENS